MFFNFNCLWKVFVVFLLLGFLNYGNISKNSIRTLQRCLVNPSDLLGKYELKIKSEAPKNLSDFDNYNFTNNIELGKKNMLKNTYTFQFSFCFFIFNK